MPILKYFNIAERRGQSVLEILIALGVFVISMTAAFQLFFGGQSLSVDSSNVGLGTDYAQEGIEAAQNIRARNWNELTDGPHGLVFQNNEWMFGSTSVNDSKDIFTRTITIGTVDANTKVATTTITWQTDPLRTQKVELVEQLTNWETVLSGGLSGDWTNPIILGSADVGAGNEGTDIKARSKIVFLTAKASTAAKDDFFIFDANNPQSPVKLASINTGPGLNGVAISGNYAYVANNDDGTQLQIIDISALNNPVLIKFYSLPGVAGSKGLSIFAANNIVYIGTEKTTGGKEFHIVDVSSPTNPQVLGNLEINEDVNGMYVKDGKAYLVTPLDAEFTVVDVSNPSSPAVLSSFDMPGNSEDGQSVYIRGAKAYVGRLRGGNHTNHHEIHVLDITNPSAVQNLGSRDTAADLNDLIVVSNLAFTATADANKEFQIFNISNPANISLYGSLNLPQVATGIDFESNIAYLSLRSNDALKIITSSP